MLKTRSFARYAALIAAVASAMGAYAAAPDNKKADEERERKLISVIESNAPPQDKAIPCRQLAICGTQAAVPALAALLSDKDLASWARIALEAIPDPAADAALREAMGKLQGKLLIGVINSIGVRRDPKAVEALAQKLKDADADVASAAAEALGRIGGEPAAKALEPLLAGAPPAVRAAAAYGCVLCAEKCLSEGKADEAAKLYDAVRKADVPQHVQLDGIRGAILARGTAGVPLLVEQLKSPDKALFGIGLRTARELPGPEATEAVVAELGKTTPARQCLLILVLADRGDPKALPTVLAAAKSGPSEVRITAMDALERLGNASCVPVLLEAALDADAEVAQAAKATLAKLPGQEADADLLARLPQASEKVRPVLIEVVGLRRIEAALPALVKCAEDADAGVRTAAVAAVGALGGQKQLPDLVRILQKTQDPKEQAGIERALTAISARSGAGCVPDLMPLTKSEESALRTIAVRTLAAAGGPDALAAVKAAANDKEEAVQDEAVRTLSTWPNKWPEDAAALGPLLALAQSAKKEQHRILALRGYLQYLQGAKKVNDNEKLAMANEVLPLITKREEKRLAISVLGTIGAAGALEKLAAYAADPATAEEACSAIVNLAAHRDLRAIPKDQRQNALQTAAEKAKSDATRKKAQELLKAIR